MDHNPKPSHGSFRDPTSSQASSFRNSKYGQSARLGPASPAKASGGYNWQRSNSGGSLLQACPPPASPRIALVSPVLLQPLHPTQPSPLASRQPVPVDPALLPALSLRLCPPASLPPLSAAPVT
eukprot:3462033-Rhodomonas_salina.1